MNFNRFQWISMDLGCERRRSAADTSFKGSELYLQETCMYENIDINVRSKPCQNIRKV
jgi:hypothetical protein